MSPYTTAYGISWQMLWVLVIIWVAIILVLSKVLPVQVGVFVATVKVAITGSFFALWGDGSWFLGGDDESYYITGIRLITSGENPISIWFSSAGNHILIDRPSAALYHWLNMFWMYVFEPAYYPPVLGNVFVTSISCLIFDRILILQGFGPRYRLGFAVFFLLHWYVLAWSSFLNIKEPVITCLLLLSIYSILEIQRGKWPYLILFSLSIFLLWGIRFYIPALLAGAAALYYVLTSRNKALLLFITTAVLAVVMWKYWNTLTLVERLSDFTPASVLKHMVKQFLSPIPWKITDPATYLIVPSILHWLLFVPAVIGGISLLSNRQTKGIWLVALTILAGYTFYSVIPALASPRHVSPFTTLWILFEYQFLFSILKWASCVDHTFGKFHSNSSRSVSFSEE